MYPGFVKCNRDFQGLSGSGALSFVGVFLSEMSTAGFGAVDDKAKFEVERTV
jgi:hypothetical protein